LDGGNGAWRRSGCGGSQDLLAALLPLGRR
jgi:hypothetical protein